MPAARKTRAGVRRAAPLPEPPPASPETPRNPPATPPPPPAPVPAPAFPELEVDDQEALDFFIHKPKPATRPAAANPAPGPRGEKRKSPALDLDADDPPSQSSRASRPSPSPAKPAGRRRLARKRPAVASDPTSVSSSLDSSDSDAGGGAGPSARARRRGKGKEPARDAGGAFVVDSESDEDLRVGDRPSKAILKQMADVVTELAAKAPPAPVVDESLLAPVAFDDDDLADAAALNLPPELLAIEERHRARRAGEGAAGAVAEGGAASGAGSGGGAGSETVIVRVERYSPRSDADVDDAEDAVFKCRLRLSQTARQIFVHYKHVPEADLVLALPSGARVFPTSSLASLRGDAGAARVELLAFTRAEHAAWERARAEHTRRAIRRESPAAEEDPAERVAVRIQARDPGMGYAARVRKTATLATLLEHYARHHTLPPERMAGVVLELDGQPLDPELTLAEALEGEDAEEDEAVLLEVRGI